MTIKTNLTLEQAFTRPMHKKLTAMTHIRHLRKLREIRERLQDIKNDLERAGIPAEAELHEQITKLLNINQQTARMLEQTRY